MLFLSSTDFFQNQLSPKKFKNTTRVSNSLDPDQTQHNVRHDLDPNCMQTLSAEDTIKYRVNSLNLDHNSADSCDNF